MQIYIHRNNQQTGPYTEDEIKAQLAAGTVTLQDHVWWQGQANWLPLGQTSLVTGGTAPIPTVPGAPIASNPAYVSTGSTSQLAVWSLVCGCLCFTLVCSSIACLPAIILGHLSLSAIKKNPSLKGRGMAIAGTIIGYFFALFVIASWVVLASMGNQVKDIFKTINSQIAEAQAAQANNNSDNSSTNSDQSTNAPDQSTPSPTPTNSPDQSTNSAPMTPATPDQSTNSGDSSTNTPPPVNAPPTNQ